VVGDGTSRLVRPVWPQSDLGDRRLWTADEAVCCFQRVGSLLQDRLANFQRLWQDLFLGLHRLPKGGDGRREGLIIRSWHPGRQLGTFCNEWRLFPTWRHLWQTNHWLAGHRKRSCSKSRILGARLWSDSKWSLTSWFWQ